MIEIKDNLDNLIITDINDLNKRIDHKLESKDIISEEIYLYSQEELDLLTQPEKKQIMKVILDNFHYYKMETCGNMTYLTYENSDIELVIRTKFNFTYSSNSIYLKDEDLDSVSRFLVSIEITYAKEKSDLLKKIYSRIRGIDTKDIEIKDFENIHLEQFKDFIYFISLRSYISYKLITKTTSCLSITIDDYIIKFNLNDIIIDLANSNHFGYNLVLKYIENIYNSIDNVDITRKKTNIKF